ncbi:MAG: ligase-associated DNA damage response endonuclease PdeM [Lysobacteraceae bacterium]|jgi:DNA ligase-associated metallophosphoesterase|nr:ligase-associated DNA damage response endonuclease PdeM [Xanthomonadaceae bacterium]MCZ8319560.1 ligase-associated DNA damage response endonuclease PdeM [Silanimonas sp.]
MAIEPAAFEVGMPRAFEIGDEAFAMYGGRALHWPVADALLIADLHLGKGAVFRRAGLPVPRGGTAGDLARLAALLARTRVARLVILGDVLHGALHDDAGWREDWAAFRAQHATLRIEAIVGNHDRALPTGADALGLVLRDEGTAERGIALCHEPEHAPPDRPSVSGHIHPAVAVPGLGRLPAFWWRARARQLVLPAFSAFTGRGRVLAAPGDRLHACAGHAVLPAPA